MRTALYAVIITMGIVILNELTYLGDTSLAVVLIVISVSIGIVACVLLKIIDQKK